MEKLFLVLFVFAHSYKEMQFNPLGSLLKTYKKGALNGCFFWEMQLSFLFFYLCFSLIACIELFPVFCVCSDWKERVSNWSLVMQYAYHILLNMITLLWQYFIDYTYTYEIPRITDAQWSLFFNGIQNFWAWWNKLGR